MHAESKLRAHFQKPSLKALVEQNMDSVSNLNFTNCSGESSKVQNKTQKPSGLHPDCLAQSNDFHLFFAFADWTFRAPPSRYCSDNILYIGFFLNVYQKLFW